MYIEAFHIDGFGIFSNVSCKGLGPGLSIFQGRNEAGKSTCLEFIRTMLTGYPERKASGVGEPLNGGHPGGSLILHCDSEPHEIRLMRSPAAFGGLRLNDANGGVLHSEILNKIFGHVDRGAYRRVFGFSLYELEKWDKKSEESIRNALYGASFGPGLASPREAGREIASRMDKIFRARGAQQPLNRALAEIESLREEIRKWEQECAGYDRQALEIDEIGRQLDELKAGKQELAERARDIERRLEQWRNWDQWRHLGIRIERLGEVPEQLPENATELLRDLRAEYTDSAKAVTAAKARLAQMEERLAGLPVDLRLVNSLAELRRLSESKGSYRQAIGNLQGLREKQESASKEMLDNLAQLGPGWDCARIRNTDRSLFARDGIEKKAAAMNEAKLAYQTDLGALESANQEVESAKKNINAAEGELAALPEQQAILNENERDELRGNMTRLEESRRITPARERALNNAVQAFNRALNNAQILGKDADEEGAPGILDNLLANQEEITSLADEIAGRLKEREAAANMVAQAENEANNARERISEANAKQKAAGGRTRENLDSRAAALRSLRALGARLESAEAQKEELDARIRQEGAPARIRNWTLVFFAALFLAAAAGIMAAHWFWNLHELVITPEAIIPINLWAAYAALVCGLLLLASGLSGNQSEHKRRKQEYERLIASSDAASMRLNDLDQQARQLCLAAGIDSYDPISLDAMEMLLEREKEQLFHEERAQRDIEELTGQLKRELARISALQAESQQKDAAVQQLRRRWHNLMQSLNVSNVPSPESIATVLERAKSAKLAEANMANAREELDALWEDLHLLESGIANMPAIKSRLEAAGGELGLEEAVRQTLESCREAERTRDIRERLTRELELGKAALERALASQQQAADKKQASREKLEAAKHEWTLCTDSLGLDGEMDPETVRAAYAYMAAALAAEEEAGKAGRDLAQASREIAAFEEPLAKLLKSCATEPSQNGAGGIDWLLSHEELLARAEDSQRALDRKQELERNISLQKDEAIALEAVETAQRNALNEFLQNSGARDANELEKFTHIRDSKRSLLERREELEASLANVAKDIPLRQFLDSFAETDEETQERELGRTREAIAELEEKEKKLTGEKAVLEERKRNLEQSAQPALLRQRLALREAEARKLARDWGSLALAESLLKEARLVFEKERQPEIIRAASEIFAHITENKWRGISLNLEDSNLVILPHEGEALAPEALSRGAQEQAYLALRLAYIKSHAKAYESLPVIMDEVLVNFDPERARRCAEAFSEMSKSGNQQILYFTCQPHVVEMLMETFENPALYRVENGAIMAA
ncbi:MAG: AAA family ATPase [Desulfovibrio sp.]|nr:AAA family ATPase [Desulfovibrio sp.]